VSANIAVVYCGNVHDVATVFGEVAERLSAYVRVLWVPGHHDARGGAHPDASFADLEWADGIAFGTPVGDGTPSAALMAFIDATEPLWSSGWLHDKVVTVFTDEPAHIAPDSLLASDLRGALPLGSGDRRAACVRTPPRRTVGSRAPRNRVGPVGPRLRAAQYRAARLARLAEVLADERHRREPLEL